MMPGDVEGLKGFLKAYEIGEMNPVKKEIPTNNAILMDQFKSAQAAPV